MVIGVRVVSALACVTAHRELPATLRRLLVLVTVIKDGVTRSSSASTASRTQYGRRLEGNVGRLLLLRRAMLVLRSLNRLSVRVARATLPVEVKSFDARIQLVRHCRAECRIGLIRRCVLDRVNAGNGIVLTVGASDNTIGGTETGGNDPTGGVYVRPPQGNLISANNANGVFITGNATHNPLSGNLSRRRQLADRRAGLLQQRHGPAGPVVDGRPRRVDAQVPIQ